MPGRRGTNSLKDAALPPHRCQVGEQHAGPLTSCPGDGLAPEE